MSLIERYRLLEGPFNTVGSLCSVRELCGVHMQVLCGEEGEEHCRNTGRWTTGECWMVSSINEQHGFVNVIVGRSQVS